jgi:hypothetical protein
MLYIFNCITEWTKPIFSQYLFVNVSLDLKKNMHTCLQMVNVDLKLLIWNKVMYRCNASRETFTNKYWEKIGFVHSVIQLYQELEFNTFVYVIDSMSLWPLNNGTYFPFFYLRVCGWAQIYFFYFIFIKIIIIIRKIFDYHNKEKW